MPGVTEHCTMFKMLILYPQSTLPFRLRSALSSSLIPRQLQVSQAGLCEIFLPFFQFALGYARFELFPGGMS